MLSKEELIVFNHYLQEGLSKSAIARKLGINRRTIHRYLKGGKTEPRYGPRPIRPSLLDPYRDYLRGRLEVYPELSAVRLLVEITAMGYKGKYSTLKDHVRSLRPEIPLPIELCFEVNPGHQAQADFSTFKAAFGTVHAQEQ